MYKKILTWVAALTLATASTGAFAGSRDQSTLIGGVIGAFAGAVIGQQAGGQNGVLPGVLIGAAAGAAIGSSSGHSDRDYRGGYGYARQPVRYAPQPVHYVPPPVYRGRPDYRHDNDRRGWHDERGGRGHDARYGRR